MAESWVTDDMQRIVALEEFNPFAWSTQKPALTDPKVSQTAFSESELGV